MQGAHAVIPKRKTLRKPVITCHTRTHVTSIFGATGMEAKYMVLNNHVLVLHGRSNRTMSTIVIFAYKMLFPSAQRVKGVMAKQPCPRRLNEPKPKITEAQPRTLFVSIHVMMSKLISTQVFLCWIPLCKD